MPAPLLVPLVGYGVSALTTIAIAALRSGRTVVPRVAAFQDPVAVWVHPSLGASWAVHADAARRWWTALGHDDLREVIVGHLPSDAEGVEIVSADAGRLQARQLALAHQVASIDGIDTDFVDDASPEDANTKVTDGPRLLRSTIYVDPLTPAEIDRTRLVAHELGHAGYGYLHCTARLGRRHAEHEHVVVQVPRHGHLMHPLYSEGGWGTAGLAAADLDLSRADLRRALRAARRGE